MEGLREVRRRLQALRLAVEFERGRQAPQVIEAAKLFYAFLTPTPTVEEDIPAKPNGD